MESLDPKVVWYWRLAAIPRMLPALITGVFIASVLPRSGNTSPQLIVSIVLVAAIAAFALWNIVSARLRFRRFRFELTGGLLRVQHGIIIRKEKVIPIDRMQHLDVDHGPIERIFGLARLSVFTAGGRTATFQLPGLSRARADSLREQIVERRDELVLPAPQATVEPSQAPLQPGQAPTLAHQPRIEDTREEVAEVLDTRETSSMRSDSEGTRRAPAGGGEVSDETSPTEN